MFDQAELEPDNIKQVELLARVEMNILSNKGIIVDLVISDDTQFFIIIIILFKQQTYLLKLGDGLRCPEDTFGSVGSNFCCLAVGSSSK